MPDTLGVFVGFEVREFEVCPVMRSGTLGAFASRQTPPCAGTKVARDFLGGACDPSGVHNPWKVPLAVFGAGATIDAALVVDVKTLHAKIGELALENDFSAVALGKTGLSPSAKR